MIQLINEMAAILNHLNVDFKRTYIYFDRDLILEEKLFLVKLMNKVGKGWYFWHFNDNGIRNRPINVMNDNMAMLSNEEMDTIRNNKNDIKSIDFHKIVDEIKEKKKYNNIYKKLNGCLTKINKKIQYEHECGNVQHV